VTGEYIAATRTSYDAVAAAGAARFVMLCPDISD
jgi:hypothetical protein